jgi:hypothetical protein
MRKYATLLVAVLLSLLSALSYAQAPVPFINLPLMPDATAPGGPQFTLTVNGTGFVSNSVVNWNGSALATQFVSGSKLTAIVPAADIATASTGWVTVVNPAPGGGTSNTGFFTVTANTGNSVGFGLASSPPTGYNPHSMTVGDFNGDGKLDLAVANACGSDPNCGSESTLSVLLGDGRGYVSGACQGVGNCKNDKPPYRHDFGSILAFIENNFLGSTAIGAINAQNHYPFADSFAPDYAAPPNLHVPLADFFPLYPTPRPFQAIVLPPGAPNASYFINYNGPILDPDNDATDDN